MSINTCKVTKKAKTVVSKLLEIFTGVSTCVAALTAMFEAMKKMLHTMATAECDDEGGRR